MRIVVKVGTRVLCADDGIGLNRKAISRLCDQLIALAAEHELLLVTSGAVGAGLLATGMKQRPKETTKLQALAAIGQSLVMEEYGNSLHQHGFNAAQLLLSYADLDSLDRRQRIEQTLESLWQIERTLPIINENDCVAVEELNFGDNDLLSSTLACLLKADELILMTSVDGFMQTTQQGEQELVAEVRDLSSLQEHVHAHQDGLSTGGMQSKLAAIEHALNCGIPASILHGRHPERLPALIAGEATVATRFLVPETTQKPIHLR